VTVSRKQISDAFERLQVHSRSGDWDAWVNGFAIDCTFVNTALSEPIVGRESLRALTQHWPQVDNNTEWFTIDSSRLVCAWNERHEGMPAGNRFRGISTYVFNPSGLVSEYEGIFDTAAIARAWSSAA